jgi:DNA-binding transcriptional regulator YhcF (GntR family)
MSRGILIIKDNQGTTKLQNLLDSISEAIASGSVQPGDSLPSVNELSRLSGYSRDTVVKAYNNLKQQSLIESTPAKGFFVSGNSPRVFMLLDDFSAFKEQLYSAFRQNLPENYSVDLLFHHYNETVFAHLISQSVGRYNSFVVMNINNKKLHPVLAKIDPKKLLILDMGDEKTDKGNYILQNFGTALIGCLNEGKELFSKYKDLIYVYSRQKTPHPVETEKALRQFCTENGLRFNKTKEFHPECIIAGQIYFVITDNDLVQVLKGCRQSGLSVGSEIGIIAYNDTPMKEIAANGITVISVDFTDMGCKAAEFVMHKQKIQEVLPTRLIMRGSL